MSKLTKWLIRPFITEDINIPVNVGDTILVGKFKNKKMKIKDIGEDDHGMPTINGRKATTFRILQSPDEEVVSEFDIPSPSRGGVNKNKTNKMSGYKQIENELNSHMENVVYSIISNDDSAHNLNESKIKKVIGVFGGRFQPFHTGHMETYNWLKKQVDEAYITTSNIKQPPRHPMNFKEKVRHMVKMGIPKNRIIEEKSPYVAKNLLKKFNSETTAVVYVFGDKDAGRLKSGKYFQKYTKNMVGYEEAGYILTAPDNSYVKVLGRSVSGTWTRDILGNPKLTDTERKQLFKKLFGYFDDGIYKMMLNKFTKLYEFYSLPRVKNLINEVSALGHHFDGNILDDEGLYDFFNSFDDYRRVSRRHAEIMGWEVLGDILSDKAVDPGFDFTYVADRVDTVTFGKTINQNTKNTDSVSNPFPKYKRELNRIVSAMGWEIVKFFGEPAVKMKDSPTFDMKTATSGRSNTNKPADPDKLKKIQEMYQQDVMMLTEGGAYGHLNHPFDNKNLTFRDFKTLIINTLQGTLDREEPVAEKTDGQNIMVSWKNGKLIAARNKGHLKNQGAAALDLNGIKSMFAGRGEIEKAFTSAIRDLENAISKLSDKQKNSIFGEGSKFMSLEVMFPATANVIPYGRTILQFHGTIEYDSTGTPIGEDRGSARVLTGMIKQINQNIQKTFSIEKPLITKLPQVKDFAKRQKYFLGKLNTLQRQFALRDTDTLAEYHEAYWVEYIYNAAKQFNYSISNKILMNLTKRWAFLDKSYKIPQMKKDIDNKKFLTWVLNTDKLDLQRLQKQHIRDWEVLFFELGAEVLKNMSDYIAANPDKAVQQIRKDLVKAISKVKKSKDPKVLQTLKVQLDRLNAIGGLKSIVPSEGITFVFKGKLYKYTGAFAPAGQILGLLKYTR